MSGIDSRADRLYSDRPSDHRSAFQRDRDRILYTSAFRRLAGVTQVAAAGEMHVFHNRLTHSLEVAQVARRTAEKLIDEQPEEVTKVGGVNADVVEAAALAHDLGHPPFGHIAEEELKLAMGRPDGFEGNPQSFRIVTKLALRSAEFPGLNLTRATLNAILKYPWEWDGADRDRSRKWGCYPSEIEEFKFARTLTPDDQKSAEAEIMDWADDITYAVHDVEDFYRAGLIPLDRFPVDDGAVQDFFDGTFKRWDRLGKTAAFSREDLENAFKTLVAMFPTSEPYRGSLRQRANLRNLTAGLIARYVNGIRLRDGSEGRRVQIDPDLQKEVTMLKELTWHYVITSSALATQQYGQKEVIRGLFKIFSNAAAENDLTIFPEWTSELLQELASHPPPATDRARVVVDMIAGLTEQQAITTYHRLIGVSAGSIFDPF